MKKKIIIVVISILILVIIGYILWNNWIVSKVALEINPSIEIGLNRKNRVVRVVPLNNDAKKVVKGNAFGKSLDETIKMITINVIDNGYVSHDEVPILVYTIGNVDNEKLTDQISKSFVLIF